MRAALVERLPDFAYHYGIRPWELSKLTELELQYFARALPRLVGGI